MENFSNFSSRHFLKLTLVTFLLILIVKTQSTTSSSATSSPNPNKSYVRKACNTTLYSTQCYNSLSPYSTKINSNPNSLCKYAVISALANARRARSKALDISKTKGLSASEKAVVRDCMDSIDNTVDELSECAKEFDKLPANGSPRAKRSRKDGMDSVKTWASAALTDDYTCTDEMVEMKVSPVKMSKFKKSVVIVAQSTSVLLALIKAYCS